MNNIIFVPIEEHGLIKEQSGLGNIQTVQQDNKSITFLEDVVRKCSKRE